MTLLHPGELTHAREGMDQLLSDEAIATIQRPTRSRDTKGGWITTWDDVADLRCSYFQILITPREQEGTTTVRAISFWTFLFPAGSDVRPSDRIKVGTRTWEVVGGGERQNELHRAVTAMEIQ